MSTVERALTSFRGADAGYFGTDGTSGTPSGTNTVGDVFGAGKPTARFTLTADQLVGIGAGIVWDVVQIDPESTVAYANVPGAPWAWQVGPGIYRVDVSLWTDPVAAALDIAFGWGLGFDSWTKGAGNTCISFTQDRIATAVTLALVAVATAPTTIEGSNSQRRSYMTITRLGDV